MTDGDGGILDGLEDDIEKQSISHEHTVAALYELLSDAGIEVNDRKGRERLAADLEAQGMRPDQLDRLVVHAANQRCDDWRRLLGSWLTEETRWKEVEHDLARTQNAMERRTAAVMKRTGGDARPYQKDHRSRAPKEEQIFYAFFYDRRPKEEIARNFDVLPTTVLEIFERVARQHEIPEAQIARHLKWGRRDKEEDHPQHAPRPEAELDPLASGGPKLYGEI